MASQWQLRLSTESQLAAKGKNAGQEFPVAWLWNEAGVVWCGYLELIGEKQLVTCRYFGKGRNVDMVLVPEVDKSKVTWYGRALLELCGPCVAWSC